MPTDQVVIVLFNTETGQPLGSVDASSVTLAPELGRVQKEEITLYKSLGIAVQDVVVANALLHRYTAKMNEKRQGK